MCTYKVSCFFSLNILCQYYCKVTSAQYGHPASCSEKSGSPSLSLFGCIVVTCPWMVNYMKQRHGVLFGKQRLWVQAQYCNGRGWSWPGFLCSELTSCVISASLCHHLSGDFSVWGLLFCSVNMTEPSILTFRVTLKVKNGNGNEGWLWGRDRPGPQSESSSPQVTAGLRPRVFLWKTWGSFTE